MVLTFEQGRKGLGRVSTAKVHPMNEVRTFVRLLDLQKALSCRCLGLFILMSIWMEEHAQLAISLPYFLVSGSLRKVKHRAAKQTV